MKPRRVCSWAVLLSLYACSGRNTTADNPGARRRGITHAAGEAPARAAPPGAEAPGSSTVAAEQAAEFQPAEAAKREADAGPRDYPAELLAAIGVPLDCLHERRGPDAPRELSVQFDAYVLETGLVNRAYARSPQLDAEELQCLGKRAGSARLRAPIEAAPRAISALLRLQLATPADNSTPALRGSAQSGSAPGPKAEAPAAPMVQASPYTAQAPARPAANRDETPPAEVLPIPPPAATHEQTPPAEVLPLPTPVSNQEQTPPSEVLPAQAPPVPP